MTDPALTDAQTARMLDLTAATPHGQRNLAALVYSGMRLGEAVGLRWEDLDLTARTFTVRRTISPNGSGKLESPPTKSGRTREVPILDDLIPFLDPPDGVRHLHIFTGRNGAPFDSGNLARATRWLEIRDQIRTFPEGESPLRFHDLRHTFLTRMSRLGALPQRLQSVAGHASVTTTELYARTSSHEAARAIGNVANREVALPNGGDGGNIVPIRAF
ncbi:MAG: site-specific integrase [Microbacterium sp.]